MPTGYALIGNRNRTDNQRRMGDAGMADHPADFRCRQEHFARLDVINFAPIDQASATMCPPLARTRRLGWHDGAGGVENAERVCRINRDAGNSGRGVLIGLDEAFIVNIAFVTQLTRSLLTLQHQHGARLVRR